MAKSLERSGREARGIGGGGPGVGEGTKPPGAGFESFRSVTISSSLLSDLFILNERADLTTLSGSWSGGSFRTGCEGSFLAVGLAGVLGGSDGSWGGRAFSILVTFGIDFVPTNGIRAFSIARSERWGREGNVDGLKAGGIIRPPFGERVLEAEVLAVPSERIDAEDIVEIVEANDSEESRLISWPPEGRLGGRAGDSCKESFRGGSLGGGFGLDGFEMDWPVRVMVGGGSIPFRLGPLGSLPMPLIEMECCPNVGATLIELLL